MADAAIHTRILRSFARSPLRFTLSLPHKVGGRVARRLAGPASRSGFLAGLYFTFLSRRFDREHCAVLAGQAAYRKAVIARQDSNGGFRRNVHRLEKALVMRPRRETFAEAYIGETVDQFVQAYRGRIDDGEKKWAGDVLSLYFDVVGDTPKIAAARRNFEALGFRADAGAGDKFVPYAKDAVEPSRIAFEDLRRLFVERRSVRWFEQRPVPVEVIEQAIEAASWAPTACNRLPYRFHVALGQERAVRIAGLAGGTAGFLANIPGVIVVVGDLSNYVEERDRHLIYIDGSLAAMQLMLALQALGLSTVPINWPDVEDRELRMQDELNLAPHERPVMLIGVGYGDDSGLIPYSQKKPVNLLLRLES